MKPEPAAVSAELVTNLSSDRRIFEPFGRRAGIITRARRHEAVHAQADRGHVAGFGERDHLARDRLGFAIEQILQQHGRLVA